jgi:hypothetical protein
MSTVNCGYETIKVDNNSVDDCFIRDFDLLASEITDSSCSLALEARLFGECGALEVPVPEGWLVRTDLSNSMAVVIMNTAWENWQIPYLFRRKCRPIKTWRSGSVCEADSLNVMVKAMSRQKRSSQKTIMKLPALADLQLCLSALLSRQI